MISFLLFLLPYFGTSITVNFATSTSTVMSVRCLGGRDSKTAGVVVEQLGKTAQYLTVFVTTAWTSIVDI